MGLHQIAAIKYCISSLTMSGLRMSVDPCIRCESRVDDKEMARNSRETSTNGIYQKTLHTSD